MMAVNVQVVLPIIIVKFKIKSVSVKRPTIKIITLLHVYLVLAHAISVKIMEMALNVLYVKQGIIDI